MDKNEFELNELESTPLGTGRRLEHSVNLLHWLQSEIHFDRTQVERDNRTEQASILQLTEIVLNSVTYKDIRRILEKRKRESFIS